MLWWAIRKDDIGSEDDLARTSDLSFCRRSRPRDGRSERCHFFLRLCDGCHDFCYLMMTTSLRSAQETEFAFEPVRPGTMMMVVSQDAGVPGQVDEVAGTPRLRLV